VAPSPSQRLVANFTQLAVQTQLANQCGFMFSMRCGVAVTCGATSGCLCVLVAGLDRDAGVAAGVFDSLTLSDSTVVPGGSGVTTPLTMCGTVPQTVFASLGPSLSLRFQSDVSLTAAGFSVAFTGRRG
jgi:hypothetical protein